MTPNWYFRYLKSLLGVFNSTADAVMDELTKVADGKTKIEMINYMNRVTLDVIGKVCCHHSCYFKIPSEFS